MFRGRNFPDDASAMKRCVSACLLVWTFSGALCRADQTVTNAAQTTATAVGQSPGIAVAQVVFLALIFGFGVSVFAAMFRPPSME